MPSRSQGGLQSRWHRAVSINSDAVIEGYADGGFGPRDGGGSGGVADRHYGGRYVGTGRAWGSGKRRCSMRFVYVDLVIIVASLSDSGVNVACGMKF